MMIHKEADVPLGITCLATVIIPKSPKSAILMHRLLVFTLTFVTSLAYQIPKKSFSAVKTVLHRDCALLDNPEQHNSTNWCNWAPFDDDENYSALFSAVDSAFLFSYGLAMIPSGLMAERMNLRYFLTFGQILTGVLACLFGLSYTWGIHSLAFYIVLQIFFGIAHSTGWPAAVAICGKWFRGKKAGLIFGIWSAHLPIGSILGSVIAGRFLENNWAFSFIVPGLILFVSSAAIFFFLVASPEDVGCNKIRNDSPVRNKFSRKPSRPPVNDAIGFVDALQLPGVLDFSLSVFFVRLVLFTYSCWLPRYIQDATTLSAEECTDLSSFYDVGGLLGSILAGIVSDVTNMPAVTCLSMLTCAIPTMYFYLAYGASALELHIFLLILTGAFTAGTSGIIMTAVSARLGSHQSIAGNGKSLATVISIIGGIGSIGSAVGPLLAGLVSPYGWDYVFYMLIASDTIAALFLFRLTFRELRTFRHKNLLKS